MLVLVLSMLAGGVQAVGAGAGYEKEPVLKASQLAPAELLKSTQLQVDEKVPMDGFLVRFTLRSDLGTFEAHGRPMLQVRVAELVALEHLEAVNNSEMFVTALGRAAARADHCHIGIRT